MKKRTLGEVKYYIAELFYEKIFDFFFVVDCIHNENKENELKCKDQHCFEHKYQLTVNLNISTNSSLVNLPTIKELKSLGLDIMYLSKDREQIMQKELTIRNYIKRLLIIKSKLLYKENDKKIFEKDMDTIKIYLASSIKENRKKEKNKILSDEESHKILDVAILPGYLKNIDLYNN